MPAGPATLSLRTGAPILPCAVYFTPRRESHHAVIRPALPVERIGSLRDDVERVTQALAHELEVLIRAGARAVAPLPAQLALRPGVWRLSRSPSTGEGSGV